MEPMQPDEEIWTFAYNCAKPIKTACAAGKFGYPHHDVEDRPMFENTHFRTCDEAWERLLVNAEAGVLLDGRSYRQAQQELAMTMEALSKTASWYAAAKDAFNTYCRERDK